MATIRKEFRSPRSAGEVWDRLRKFEAVHELAPGFVARTTMAPDGARVVTFVNDVEVREFLVSSNDAERRLVYAITDNPRFTHYNAAAQVFEDGQGSRFVWTVDFLPDEAAELQEMAMTAGAGAMSKALA